MGKGTRQVRTLRRPGAVAAELALVLPFLVFMLAIAVDFCRVFYFSQVVQACAETGAFYASATAQRNPSTATDDSQAATQAAVAEGSALNPPLAASQVTVTSTGGAATVTVTYQLPMITTVPGMPTMLTIRRAATMTMAPQAGQ